MDQHSKSELLRSYRKRYERASKKEKTSIINSIVDATGYCRKHVIRAMNMDVRVPKKVARVRCSRYAHLYKTLKRVWAASNFLCGKERVSIQEKHQAYEESGSLYPFVDHWSLPLSVFVDALERGPGLLGTRATEARIRNHIGYVASSTARTAPSVDKPNSEYRSSSPDASTRKSN